MSYSRETNAVTETQKYLEKLYLIYSEGYLTVAAFAEDQSIPPELAKAMIDEGRLIHRTEGCLY